MADAFSLPKRVHFIGICGTAMGAVAIALKQRGVIVSGSDEKVYPPMSDQLRAHGIALMEGYRQENLDADIELVVVGNAISRGNEELESVLDQRMRYASLPETLRLAFLGTTRNIVVTGTHGKTTTSALTTWILTQASTLDPNWLIGGVPRGLNQGCRIQKSDWFVLEGDEYDTAFFDKRSKFVHYLPEVLICNNLEFDHADIFENLAAVQKSFSQVIRIVPRMGLILVNGDDANLAPLLTDAPADVQTVGLGNNCSQQITSIEKTPEGTTFSLNNARYFVPLVGEFNLRNAAMAICASLHAGLTQEKIAAALAQFPGVARRQDYKGEVAGIRVIDDFAHHPTAIAEAIAGLRQRYSGNGGRLWAVFEPRSNTSRRKIMQQELAQALSTADLAVLAAVENPEKVAQELRLCPQEVVETLKQKKIQAWHESGVDAIIQRILLEAQSGDTIAIFSNGGFDGIHGKLLAALEKSTTNCSSL